MFASKPFLTIVVVTTTGPASTPNQHGNDTKMNENAIVECFAVAEKKLLDAIDRQRSGSSDGHNRNDEENETGEISSDGGATNSVIVDDEDIDPDDMEAAYFAMQSKKRRDEERQNEKVFGDWATIILRQQQQRRDDSGSRNRNPGALLEAEEASVSLADDLLAEFKRILSS